MNAVKVFLNRLQSQPVLLGLTITYLICAGFPLGNPQAENSTQTRARLLFKQGKFPEAAAAYRAILEKDGASAIAYAGLTQSYLKADDAESADEASHRGLLALPRSAVVHAVRGDVLFRKGLLAEAENEYRAALKLDENCARALLGMGRISSAVSDSQGAQAYFAKAHELDPDDGDALYRWATLLSYPQSVKELERHLGEYHSSADEERREREFIELVRGIGSRETWIGPKEIHETEVRLEPLSPRPGAVLGLGMRMKLNDKASATLLLDTGASWMTIPRSLAEKAGARKISEYAIEGVGDSGPAAGYFAWIDQITVGGVEFHDCVVHVALKDTVPGLDGIIGPNIFSKYQVTIDFPGKKLRLAHLPDPTHGNGTGHSLIEINPGTSYIFGHILLLQTSVNNSASGLFVLDSGANVSSIAPEVAQRVGKLQEVGNHISGFGGQVSKTFVLQDATLRFSAAAEPKHDLTAFDTDALSRQLETAISGFIGFDMLSRMKVQINYQEGKVEFKGSGH